MNEETAKKARLILNEIETVRRHIKSIPEHSFGMGTAFYDFDEAMRPFAKMFLEKKLASLLNKLYEV